MASKSKDKQGKQKKSIQLDLPQRNTDNNWIAVMGDLYSKLGAVICNEEVSNVSDRIEYMVHLIISTITDSEEREEIREDLIKEVESILNNGAPPDKARKQITIACLKRLGKVTDYADMSMGISHKLEIGEF